VAADRLDRDIAMFGSQEREMIEERLALIFVGSIPGIHDAGSLVEHEKEDQQFFVDLIPQYAFGMINGHG
jgi:hypothetical protein